MALKAVNKYQFKNNNKNIKYSCHNLNFLTDS